MYPCKGYFKRMNLLEKHQIEIQQLCIKYNVDQLYVFGSILTDEFKESSDVFNCFR